MNKEEEEEEEQKGQVMIKMAAAAEWNAIRDRCEWAIPLLLLCVSVCRCVGVSVCESDECSSSRRWEGVGG